MFGAAIAALPQLSYLGLFLFLLGGSIVIPVPEEVTLLTAGYLVARGLISPWIGIPLAVAGLFLGDSILFALARFGSSYAHKLRERVNTFGLERTWIFSPSHPLRPVFILRFITGFRFIASIYAGFEEVSWLGYILTDIASIILFVPLLFALGFAFHATILPFIAGFEVVRHAVFIVILAIAGTGILADVYERFKKRRTKK